MTTTVKRWNILLIIAAVLGSAYAIYLSTYIANSSSQTGSAGTKAGIAIAVAIMTPHLILVITAAVLNIITVFTNSPILALLTAIFYSVAALVFLLYILFVIPSIVLSWIGFVQLRKRSKDIAEAKLNAAHNAIPSTPSN
ncbi:MAG: hypothetical protein WBA28_07905 [Microbacteriaceae bacterium]